MARFQRKAGLPIEAHKTPNPTEQQCRENIAIFEAAWDALARINSSYEPLVKCGEALQTMISAEEIEIDQLNDPEYQAFKAAHEKETALKKVEPAIEGELIDPVPPVVTRLSHYNPN